MNYNGDDIACIGNIEAGTLFRIPSTHRIYLKLCEPHLVVNAVEIHSGRIHYLLDNTPVIMICESHEITFPNDKWMEDQYDGSELA